MVQCHESQLLIKMCLCRVELFSPGEQVNWSTTGNYEVTKAALSFLFLPSPTGTSQFIHPHWSVHFTLTVSSSEWNASEHHQVLFDGPTCNLIAAVVIVAWHFHSLGPSLCGFRWLIETSLEVIMERAPPSPTILVIQLVGCWNAVMSCRGDSSLIEILFVWIIYVFPRIAKSVSDIWLHLCVSPWNHQLQNSARMSRLILFIDIIFLQRLRSPDMCLVRL